MVTYREFSDAMLVAAAELAMLDGHAAWNEFLAAGGPKAPEEVKGRLFHRIALLMATLKEIELELRRRGGQVLRLD